ncbi:uncharacterized protein [Procambarus clarkii]|uniref:uncharacterized protein n=1 Tax=Procambarus clarkii TaxID=6728 RepID=UPI0037424F5A
MNEITEGLHTLVERQRANQGGKSVSNFSTNAHHKPQRTATTVVKPDFNKSSPIWNSGNVEVVEENNHKLGHYLPHHAVLKDSVTTPIRFVFNCSAKLKADSVSLNDCLQTGPSLTEKLQDVLLRFRSGVFAYTADISEAFLRVGLQETDRDFTKFLLVKDPHDPNSEIITYRFASVLFRATSSPFLLQATLDTHLKKSNSPYKTEISNNLYIDNFQGTTNDENKLVEIYHEANHELLGANMPLQSWAPNVARFFLVRVTT